MIRRHLEKTLRAVARQYPAVTLTGPRQSGKTTLVRKVFKQHDYVSLEDPDQRAFADEDPRGFLDQFSGAVVLDEVQRVPELFSYIQSRVDSDDAPGRFMLSGSQNFLLLEAVSQSLAGRCAILHLLPFSQAELQGRPVPALPGARRSRSRTTVGGDVNLMEMLFRGSYPRIHDKGLEPQRWLRGYYQTYVERDVREIVNVGNLESFGRFVRLCAGRTGQLLNLSSLASDCGITQPTAKRWLSILEASFLVVLLRPHYRNFNKRLIKSPKLYFLDSGLLCYLLRVREPGDLALHGSRGAIFESFVVSELMKHALHAGREPDLYFWRDAAGHEIDLIAESGKELTAIEIKSGQTFAGDFFKGLDYWLELIGDRSTPTALVYGGDRSFRRNSIPVVSWREL